jgi:hypothetical protein
MKSLETRVHKLETQHLKWRFSQMSDAQLLTLMSPAMRAHWKEAGVADQEIAWRIRRILKEWGYLE